MASLVGHNLPPPTIVDHTCAVHFDIHAAMIGVSFTTGSDTTTSEGTGTSIEGVCTGNLLRASALVFCAPLLVSQSMSKPNVGYVGWLLELLAYLPT